MEVVIRFKMPIQRGPRLDVQTGKAVIEEMLFADVLNFRKLTGLTVNVEPSPEEASASA